VKDSKKLTREEHAVLVPDIISTGMGHHIAELPNTTIDKIGMTQSLQLLYEECLEQLGERFPSEFAEALIVIDGKLWARHIEHISLPKGDDIVPHVSAASILAKYQRDTWMIEVADKIYPEYSFDKHKGYGTKRHRSMIARHGICPLHRTTFLKNANAWKE
jgi:ribonuclease HII